MTERKGGLAPWMFTVLAMLLVMNLWSTWGVDREIETVIRQTSIRHTTMITKWHSKNGILHEITTHLGESDPAETDSEHAHRHSMRFTAMLLAFPKPE